MRTTTSTAASFAVVPRGRVPMILSVSLIGFSTAAVTAATPPAGNLSANSTRGAADRNQKAWPTEDIRNLIRAAFNADARVPSGRIGIAVGADVIALFGTVPDERAKRAALELARAIPGAPPIYDRLRIG